MLNTFLRGPEVSEGILGLSDSRDLALLPGEYDGFWAIVVSPTIPGASPGIFGRYQRFAHVCSPSERFPGHLCTSSR